MKCAHFPGIIMAACLGLQSIGSIARDEMPPLRDKTLVAWVSLTQLTQRAGSALTLDDGQSHFDGIVFGELAPRKWMPGSDSFSRTMKEQADWPEETAEGKTFVQVAVVYQGSEVTVFCNGQKYAHYTMPNPPRTFGP